MEVQSKWLFGSLFVFASIVAVLCERGVLDSDRKGTLVTERRSLAVTSDPLEQPAQAKHELVPGASLSAARTNASDPVTVVAAPIRPARALVRVRGQVLEQGRPVAGYDLVFQPTGEGASDVDDDWDSTDEDGCFAVELASASYVVLNNDEGPWVTNLIVPTTDQVLVIDIHLTNQN